MINFIVISLLLFANNAYSSVVVLGTKFFFNKDSKRINIKTINDNESDYLVKVEVKGDKRFIVSPPLMLLKKNQSNIVTIIPNNIEYDEDKVFDLVVTTIPKVDKNINNSVHLALRSNFKLVYRHEPLQDDAQKYLSFKTINNNVIINHSKSYITFFMACNKDMTDGKTRFSLLPESETLIPRCINDTWVSIVRDDNSVGLPTKLL